jgi:linoleoyl-CoA desaturase
MQNNTFNLWSIHGKQYDLSSFLDSHPGGRTILEACKGNKDCTAAFESYHAMVNMNKIESIMSKYEIGISDIQPHNTFNHDGFYQTVKFRVRQYFNQNTQSYEMSNYHSNLFWLFKTIIMCFLYFNIFYYAFYSLLNIWLRVCFAGLAGFIGVQIGFIVLHDASHCAISKYSYINDFLSRITNAFILWDHRLWMTHHVYLHHSFTSDHKLDPDTMHLRPFVKKHPEDSESKFNKLFRLYPKITTLISTMIFPGIYVGQAFVYHFVWLWRQYLWGMKLPHTYKTTYLEIFIKLFVIFSFIYSQSFLIVISYLISCNISYFIAIMPDHDMISTTENRINHSTDNLIDWGEMQVRNSGNFATNSIWLTELYGGINYQIEHHLFPTICHVHYRAIQHIIKNTCKEFNIKYVESQSLCDAVIQVLDNFTSIR